MRSWIWMLAGALLAIYAPAAPAATFTGRLQERHGHRLDGSEVGESWRIVNGSAVHALSDSQPERLLGQQVTVTDADTRTPQVQGNARAATDQRVVAAPPPGPQTALVMIVTTPDATSPAFTVAAARSAVFTAPDSASAFFRRQSNGATSLVGRVDPSGGDVVQVAIATPMAGCDPDAIAAGARAAADEQGWDTAGYEHRIYLHPRSTDCQYAGLAYMPGNDVWSNGYLQWSVLGHELGHNMGAHHANALNCVDASGRAVALSEDCTNVEYEDPFDVMGRGGLMGAWHVAQLGELPPAQTISLRQSANLAIYPVDGLPSGLHNLMIPIKEPRIAVTRWYALDVRGAASPFNAFAAGDPVTTGITIRIVPALDATIQSELIDTNAGAGVAHRTAALQPGRSFSDPKHGITIAAVAAGGGAVGAEVTMPALVDDVPPSAVASLFGTGDTSAVSLSWRAATDDEQVDHYDVIRDGTPIGSAGGLTFRDADTAGLVSPTYQVVAVDPSGNRGPAAARQLTLRDVGAPSAVGSLTASATQGGVTLSWPAASDNRAVSSYSVARDGAFLSSTAATALSDRPTAGAHRYTVEAVDATGNHGGSAAADVTMPASPPPPSGVTPPPRAPTATAPAGPAVPTVTRPALAPPSGVVATASSVHGAVIRIASRRTQRLSRGRRRQTITFVCPHASTIRVASAGRRTITRSGGRVQLTFTLARGRRFAARVSAGFGDGTASRRWVFR